LEQAEGIDGSLGQGCREWGSSLGQVGEGGGNLGIIPDESTVKASKAQEGTGGGDVVRQRPVSNSGSLVGVDRDTMGRDVVAEEASGILGKGAFGQFDFEVGIREGFEDLCNVHEVVLFGFGVDHDIIKEDNNELVKEGLKDSLHEAHEGGWGIGETKGHDSEFEASIPGFEGSLVDVIGVNAALVITRP
jgi:hypothetical protein